MAIAQFKKNACRDIEESEYFIKISDVWSAVRITIFSFFVLALISYLVGGYISEELLHIPNGYLLVLSLILSFIPVYKIWCVYNQGYVIDLKNGTFIFPASDVENSFWEIITLKRLRGVFYREELLLDQIEALNNETISQISKKKDSKGVAQRKQNRKYALNISGEFGSRQFVFKSKQKRDEYRAILNRVMRNRDRKVHSSDYNLDFQ